MLADVAEEERAGKAAYMDADLHTSVQHLQRALDDLVATSDRIWRLKDQALFWVYLTEWLVVASTGMVGAVVVWTVMVRRRLYRESGVTRLRRSEA